MQLVASPWPGRWESGGRASVNRGCIHPKSLTFILSPSPQGRGRGWRRVISGRLTQHDFYHFGPTIRTQENTFVTDQAVGPNMVDIKLMLGRFNPPDEIQGPDSLCVGGELLFRAEKLVTSPQFELPLSARNTWVSTGPDSGRQLGSDASRPFPPAGSNRRNLLRTEDSTVTCAHAMRAPTHRHHSCEHSKTRLASDHQTAKTRGARTFKRSNPESDFRTIDMQELVQIEVLANSKQSYCYET